MIPTVSGSAAKTGAAIVLSFALAGMFVALGWYIRGSRADAEIAGCNLAASEVASTAIHEAWKQEAAYRARERELEKESARAAQEAQAKIDAAQRAAADARNAADRLRQRAQALASAASCTAQGPDAPASSASAPAPGFVLADMLRWIDAAAGELAEYADRSRIAGAACERAYDSVSQQP